MTDKSRRFTGLWNAETIRQILSHPVYQGDMAQQFTRTVNYKVHLRRRVDCGGGTPSAVGQPGGLCPGSENAKSPYMRNDRPSPSAHRDCLLCRLRQPALRKKRGQYWYLNCYGYYRDPVAHRCTSHSIREDRVVRAVEDALHALAQNQVDIQGVIQKCARKQHHAQDVQGQRRKLEQQLENARRARLDAYKDKAAGILQAEEFDYISRSLRQEEARCRQELDRLARQEENRSQLCILEQKIRVFLQFDHLEKSQLQQLVRRVEVDDRKQIHIFFNFAAPRKEGDCPPF